MLVNIHEAKTHLSKLIMRVVAGEEVIIAKAGKPLVRIVPCTQANERRAGRYAGQGYIAEDFNAPLRQLEDDFYNA